MPLGRTDIHRASGARACDESLSVRTELYLHDGSNSVVTITALLRLADARQSNSITSI